MQITLYSFNKRINSTKIVNVNGTTVDFTYKDEADIYNPIIELSYDIKENNINYAKIDNRYYFINSVDSVRMNLWRAHLKIDLLASFKEYILNTKAFVRFSSNKSNPHLIDSRIVTSGKWSDNVVTISLPNYSDDGMFVLSVISNAGDASGFATNFILTPAELNALVIKLLEADGWDEVVQWVSNPMEAIVSCWWLPFNVSNMYAMSEKEIKIGKYSTGIMGRVISNRGFKPFYHGCYIDIPFGYSDFRNLEPYTTVKLYLPFVGYIDIDTSDIYGSSKLYIQYGIDILTGNIQYIIKPADADSVGDVIATADGSVRLDLPVGQVQSATGAILAGVAGGVASLGLMASGMVFAGMTSAAYALTATLQRRQTFQNGGFRGSTLTNGFGDGRYITLYLRYRETNDTPENMRDTIGGLSAKVLTLSECSGYVLTENASVTISGYYEATSQINALLNGGVYIE